MRLTVLGASGTHPGAEEPCSGYLLEAADRRIVLDLGFGTFGPLLAAGPIHAIDAIVVSHGHPDHTADLLAWHHAARHGKVPRAIVPLYAPDGVVERLAGFLGASATSLDLTFAHHPVGPGDAVDVGGVALRFGSVVHPVPAVAVRVEVPGGGALVYSGDTAWSDDLVRLASGAALFVCEATTVADPLEGVHLDAHEAGDLASAAGVGALLLTHLRPGEDHEAALAAARSRFDGPVAVAKSGHIHAIG